MKRTQKPMMLAYIIFLCICLGFHIIRSVFKIDFPMWNRVVVAATIASYFFSLGSVNKLIVRLERTNTIDLQEEIVLLQKIRKKESKLCIDNATQQELINDMDNAISENNERIKSGEKDLQKYEAKSFWCDVLGYLVFFCILSFETLFKFFKVSQELYTLLAFIVVIVVEYLESTKVAYYDELRKNTIDRTRKKLAYLEDIENG